MDDTDATLEAEPESLGGKMHLTNNSATNENGKSLEIAARKAGVSYRTACKAMQIFKKAPEKLEEAANEDFSIETVHREIKDKPVTGDYTQINLLKKVKTLILGAERYMNDLVDMVADLEANPKLMTETTSDEVLDNLMGFSERSIPLFSQVEKSIKTLSKFKEAA
ncbi:MAG: hypothetical protein HQK96_12925 [Nitrospirae bacterium]|nr:hypothetical protein [Nitrospirota bacterium]